MRVLLLTHRSFDWNHRRLHALCHDGGLHQDVCKDALARKALSCSQTAACMAAKEPPEQTRVTLCAQARRSLPSMTPWILRSVAAFRFRSHTCASNKPHAQSDGGALPKKRTVTPQGMPTANFLIHPEHADHPEQSLHRHHRVQNRTYAVRLFRQKTWQSVWSELHFFTPAQMQQGQQ